MTWTAASVAQTALDPAFTYQGRLKENGIPANGEYDFQFTLYDAAMGGNLVAGPILIENQPVESGLFTVRLDFEAAPFAGEKRWLQIAVRPGTSGDPHTALSPRQELTAAPYALYALSAPAGGDADTVDGFHASATPTANTLLALDANVKFPNSVLNAGAGGGLDVDLLDGQRGGFYQDASNLNAGTLPGARLSGTYGNALTFPNVGNSFSGNGAGLTNLNASNLATGTVADPRLSTNVALLNNVQTFTAAKTFSAAPSFTAAGALFTVTSGTVVTNLNADLLDGQQGSFYQNAGNLNAGTLSDARLSANVALLSGAQTFSGAKTFSARPTFTSTGAPFTVSSNTVVTNLNADLLDGLNSTVFLQSVPNPLTLSGSHSGNSSGNASIIKGTNTSGTYADGVAGYVTAASSSISGVGGYATGASGVGRGVYGEARSSSGIGVLGVATDTVGGGEACGVWGDTTSPTGYGVRGTGGLRGLYGEASTAGSSAVWARNDSTSGYAVYAWAAANSGTNYAVYGETSSASGYAGYFSGRGYFSGNVGVGVSAPGESLDVSGTARLRGIGSSTGTTVVADANGKLWKLSSSIRYKADVQDLRADPARVLDLRPVRFQWKATGQSDIGLIAEEVKPVLGDLVICDVEGQPDAVKYDKLALYLLGVVKEQRKELSDLRARLERIEASFAEAAHANVK